MRLAGSNVLPDELSDVELVRPTIVVPNAERETRCKLQAALCPFLIQYTIHPFNYNYSYSDSYNLTY